MVRIVALTTGELMAVGIDPLGAAAIGAGAGLATAPDLSRLMPALIPGGCAASPPSLAAEEPAEALVIGDRLLRNTGIPGAQQVGTSDPTNPDALPDLAPVIARAPVAADAVPVLPLAFPPARALADRVGRGAGADEGPAWAPDATLPPPNRGRWAAGALAGPLSRPGGSAGGANDLGGWADGSRDSRLLEPGTAVGAATGLATRTSTHLSSWTGSAEE